jgi:hypothetical protein
MSKKYEYFVALIQSDSQFPSVKNITASFDHEITPKDIKDIENRHSGVFLGDLIVTFYMLLKVTGTFTYQYLFSHKYPNGTTEIETATATLDHPITLATIQDDYERLKDIFYKNRGFVSPPETVRVIFHQEIPDE